MLNDLIKYCANELQVARYRLPDASCRLLVTDYCNA